jgi:hypothetical protein
LLSYEEEWKSRLCRHLMNKGFRTKSYIWTKGAGVGQICACEGWVCTLQWIVEAKCVILHGIRMIWDKSFESINYHRLVRNKEAGLSE